MKTKIAISLFFFFVCITTNVLAKSYANSIKLDEMEFYWTVEGPNLAAKVSAKTTGWVGVGFNPQNKMKGANFIIGYVKGDQVKISDEYGIRPTGHASDDQRGGSDSIISSSGSEKGNLTTLEFEIPLNSGDKTDTVIDPNGKTVLLLAYGPRDSFRIGHKYHKVLEVNLGTGEYHEVLHQ